MPSLSRLAQDVGILGLTNVFPFFRLRCARLVWRNNFDGGRFRLQRRVDHWLLIGETSLWVFPIYDSMAFLFEPLHDVLRGQFFPIRALIFLISF